MTETPLFAEPTVDDMLADPIVQLVMQRDGVEEAELRRTLRRLAVARGAAHRKVRPVPCRTGPREGEVLQACADGA